MKHWSDRLVEMDACKEAVEWCRKYRTPTEAWKACKCAEWMLWLLVRRPGPLGGPVHRRLVQVACAIARTVRVPKGDIRPMRAIRAAEAWARKPSVAASDALREACEAVSSATSDVVWAAEWAVREAAWATWVNRDTAHVRPAAIVRRYFPRPPRLTKERG